MPPPPPIVLGYCSQLSIKLKIQDGAREQNVLKIRESPIVDSLIMSRDEKDVRGYRNLAKNEARYRLKERILEQMILSVDNLDNFHESFMMKLEHDHFCNLLLPSDVQEIKQAVGHRLKNIDSTRT